MKNPKKKLALLLSMVMLFAMVAMMTSAYAGTVPEFAYNSPAKQVAVGILGTAVLSSDGYVYVCGESQFGGHGNGKWQVQFKDKNGQSAYSADFDYPKDISETVTSNSPGHKNAEQRLFHKVQTAPGAYLKNIVKIYAAARNWFAIDKSGHIWAWGSNESYIANFSAAPFTKAELLGKCSDPVVEYAMDVTSMWNKAGLFVDINTLRIAAGGLSHVLVIDKNKKLWSWGRAYLDDIKATKTDFRLGYDTGSSGRYSRKPQMIPLLKTKNIVDVGAMTVNSYALDDKGNAYVWGRGGGYQVLTVKVSDAKAKPFKQLAVGGACAFLLGNDGKIYQVENGIMLKNKSNAYAATPFEGDFASTPDFMGPTSHYPAQLSKAVLSPLAYPEVAKYKFVEIHTGGNPEGGPAKEAPFVFAKTDTGDWWAFGHTAKGQTTLAQGTHNGELPINGGVFIDEVRPGKVFDKNFKNLQMITTFHDHCAGIGKDGKVYTWGTNSEKELGHLGRRPIYVVQDVDTGLVPRACTNGGDKRVLPVQPSKFDFNKDVNMYVDDLSKTVPWANAPKTSYLKLPTNATPTPTLVVATGTPAPSAEVSMEPGTTPTPEATATAEPNTTVAPTAKPDGGSTGDSSGLIIGIIAAVVVLGGGGFALYKFVLKKK